MSLHDQLISYWKLDEASGTRNDSHGANHLADVNTVTQAAGRVGNAAQFTAANVERLNIVDNPSLSINGSSFTVAAWVWMDTKVANMGIAARDDVGANREFGLYFLSSDNTMRFDVAALSVATRTAPAAGQWVFVVGWRDAVANTNNVQVDNGTVGSNSNATEGGDTAAPFTIGSRAAGNIPFNGRIDEVGFWKRVLTADERTYLYNSGNGLTYEGLLPPIAATLAVTEAADACVAAGTVLVEGDLATTEAADAAALVGAVRVAGQLAVTETADVCAMAAEHTYFPRARPGQRYRTRLVASRNSTSFRE